MTALLYLDCDGTLYTDVSPCSACDQLPSPRMTHPDRAQALREAAERNPLTSHWVHKTERRYDYE